MVRLAIMFFVVALLAAYVGGFGGISNHAWQGANTAFFIFLVLGALALLARALRWPYA